MKGLLYKDVSIMTRSFKGNILLLEALYGVLSLVTKEAYLAYAMTAVWGIYVASTINYDEQAHWDAYAATLPVTPGQVIASKYLLCAASTAIGAALSLALVLLAGVGGAEYTLGILACAEVSVLTNALLMPITYRFGAAKSRAYLMVIVFAIVFGACFAAQEVLQSQSQAVPLSPYPCWQQQSSTPLATRFAPASTRKKRNKNTVPRKSEAPIFCD